MYRLERLNHKEDWVLKNWSFQIVVLEKTLESTLDKKEIKPVNPKGNQRWVFIGRTVAEAEAPIQWPLDVKSWLIGKDPGKDWRQKEKGATEVRRLEDEMVREHPWLGVNLSKFREIVKDKGAWHAAAHGVSKSQTQLRDWTTAQADGRDSNSLFTYLWCW